MLLERELNLVTLTDLAMGVRTSHRLSRVSLIFWGAFLLSSYLFQRCHRESDWKKPTGGKNGNLLHVGCRGLEPQGATSTCVEGQVLNTMTLQCQGTHGLQKVIDRDSLMVTELLMARLSPDVSSNYDRSPSFLYLHHLNLLSLNFHSRNYILSCFFLQIL